MNDVTISGAALGIMAGLLAAVWGFSWWTFNKLLDVMEKRVQSCERAVEDASKRADRLEGIAWDAVRLGGTAVDVVKSTPPRRA